MTAECARTKLMFQGLDGREVVGRFDGGEIPSDAGGVLLREVEQRTGILGRLSKCFTDHPLRPRSPESTEQSLPDPVTVGRSSRPAAGERSLPGGASLRRRQDENQPLGEKRSREEAKQPIDHAGFCGGNLAFPQDTR